MNGLGGWFRQLGARLSQGYRSFMAGRYGTDRLNMVILVTGAVFCFASMFVSSVIAKLVLMILSYVCMIWAIFRAFSRNTYQRYQENRRFRMIFERLRDREHRYFDCPRCRQPVRVPRGKGKIAITCPKCREKFIRKT